MMSTSHVVVPSGLLHMRKIQHLDPVRHKRQMLTSLTAVRPDILETRRWAFPSGQRQTTWQHTLTVRTVRTQPGCWKYPGSSCCGHTDICCPSERSISQGPELHCELVVGQVWEGKGGSVRLKRECTSCTAVLHGCTRHPPLGVDAFCHWPWPKAVFPHFPRFHDSCPLLTCVQEENLVVIPVAPECTDAPSQQDSVIFQLLVIGQQLWA